MAAHRNVMDKQLILDRIKKDANGCWNWTAYILDIGYGQINIARKQYQAHRVSAHLWNGFDLKSKLFICHTCDNRACVNPEHLFAGDPQANSSDMVKKNRSAKGEKSARSKLRESDVKEIRLMLVRGHQHKEIAKLFNVTRYNIQAISSGKTWRHL